MATNLDTLAARREGSRRLAAVLSEATGEDGPILPDHWRVFDWQPLFNGNAEILTAIANVRQDTVNTLPAAVMLAGMTPDQMRGYVRQGDLERAADLLETLWEYHGRVATNARVAEVAFARLFAASHEAFGLPARPALKAVEA